MGKYGPEKLQIQLLSTQCCPLATFELHMTLTLVSVLKAYTLTYSIGFQVVPISLGYHKAGS